MKLRWGEWETQRRVETIQTPQGPYIPFTVTQAKSLKMANRLMIGSVSTNLEKQFRVRVQEK